MSLNSELMRVPYAANGSTYNFSFPWAFQDATDLDVYLVDELGTVLGTPGAEFYQTFVTKYDVVGKFNPLSGANDDFSSGASVNFVTAPVTGYTVVILRNTPDTQDTSLINNSAYSSSVIETAMDKIVMMVQYLFDRSSRSIRMSDANPQTFNPVLPNPIVANSAICVDSTGQKIIMGPTVATITAAANASTAAVASAAAALASQTAAAGSAAAAAASAATAASFSAGAMLDTAFTIVNNQSTPANVTGLLFNGASVRSAEINIQIYRNTTGGGATELASRAKYLASYKTVAAVWDITPTAVTGDEDLTTGMPAGVTLSITAAGQVQYTSTNLTGTPGSSTLHFSATTLGV